MGFLFEVVVQACCQLLQEEGVLHFVQAGGDGFGLLVGELLEEKVLVDVSQEVAEAVRQGVLHILLEEVCFQSTKHIYLTLLAMRRLEIRYALPLHIVTL